MSRSVVDLARYRPVGDKENSAFFGEYLVKIYQRRASSGLDDIFGAMAGVILQVETDDGVAYLAELYLMTPYRLAGTWLSSTHRIYVLTNRGVGQSPAFIVLEPLSSHFEDHATRLNRLYPSAREKSNARDIGELYHVGDLCSAAGTLEDQDIRFEHPGDTENGFYTHIVEMNSSTNVNRNPTVSDDKASPAKVFTANNVPSFVNSFERRPMPTEDFVRNYGRRMHHLDHEIRDGDRPDGEKNVDYVVGALAANGVGFLADVVGACDDEPDLKQIFSKHSAYSILITEYIERCHGYEGFFTKTNVAALTEAAGRDERLTHGHVFD